MKILKTLFEIVLFEDCGNQWSLSRPMLSLILISEQVILLFEYIYDFYLVQDLTYLHTNVDACKSYLSNASSKSVLRSIFIWYTSISYLVCACLCCSFPQQFFFLLTANIEKILIVLILYFQRQFILYTSLLQDYRKFPLRFLLNITWKPCISL